MSNRNWRNKVHRHFGHFWAFFCETLFIHAAIDLRIFFGLFILSFSCWIISFAPWATLGVFVFPLYCWFFFRISIFFNFIDSNPMSFVIPQFYRFLLRFNWVFTNSIGHSFYFQLVTLFFQLVTSDIIFSTSTNSQFHFATFTTELFLPHWIALNVTRFFTISDDLNYQKLANPSLYSLRARYEIQKFNLMYVIK